MWSWCCGANNTIRAIVNASMLTLLGAQYVKAKLCVLHRAMNMYERNGGRDPHIFNLRTG
jgi:hypothetical protein